MIYFKSHKFLSVVLLVLIILAVAIIVAYASGIRVVRVSDYATVDQGSLTAGAGYSANMKWIIPNTSAGWIIPGQITPPVWGYALVNGGGGGEGRTDSSMGGGGGGATLKVNVQQNAKHK